VNRLREQLRTLALSTISIRPWLTRNTVLTFGCMPWIDIFTA
jgi:hypothetical protein